MKRAGTINVQFEQRIPSDVLPRAAGLKLSIPLGDGEFRHITIAAKARSVRFSLGTFDPSIAKSRQGRVVAYLEDVWRGMRQSRPVTLTNRQAVALSRDLYAAWVSGEGRERTVAILHTADGWVRDSVLPNEEAEIFALFAENFAQDFEKATETKRFGELEAKLGPIIDRLLLARGIREVDAASRQLLLLAFASAIRDALRTRQRNAERDYRPDPNSERFPEWRPAAEAAKPAATPVAASVPLKALVDEWWVEAEKTGIKRVTYVNYRNVVLKFSAFLEHDDAACVTPDDVIRYKDHRLASIYPNSGKLISPKTVKDTDLAALKTVFGWAVANRKLRVNAAAGLTVKLRKQVRLRGKSQTEEEAAALLRGALAYQPGGLESAFTTAAKRWVPWLCAYTGSRIGEMAQLRKQDIRQEGGHWVARITPDAGTVKNNEARDVVLHAHLVELGFPAFVAAAPRGHL